MEPYTQHLILGLIAGALILFTISSSLYVRANDLKRKCATMNAELEKTPVSVLVEKFSQQKMSLDVKVAKGRAAMARLTELHAEAEKKVQKIKAGLPSPNFKVDDDEDLKSAIRDIRSKQYRLIELNDATRSLSNWEWFGSKSDGKTLIQNYNKLMIGALNAEVEMARSKMRHGSFDTAINKLEASVKALEKLAETVRIRISPEYLLAKEEELRIWHADLLRRHEEKEARKHQRALLREQNQVLGRGSSDDDEDEEARNELEACAKELAKARELARQIAGEDLAELELKIQKIEEENAN